nr:hypothetical protein [Mycoplasmopsis bovis]
MSELFKKLVYLNHYSRLLWKNWWAYSNIITSVDRINEFKGNQFWWHLKSYNSDEVFFQWSRKARLKVAKILPYFTLVLIYQRANLSQPYQGYAGFDYFWGLFGKCASWEILVADKGFRTKAIQAFRTIKC